MGKSRTVLQIKTGVDEISKLAEVLGVEQLAKVIIVWKQR